MPGKAQNLIEMIFTNPEKRSLDSWFMMYYCCVILTASFTRAVLQSSQWWIKSNIWMSDKKNLKINSKFHDFELNNKSIQQESRIYRSWFSFSPKGMLLFTFTVHKNNYNLISLKNSRFVDSDFVVASDDWWT